MSIKNTVTEEQKINELFARIKSTEQRLTELEEQEEKDSRTENQKFIDHEILDRIYMLMEMLQSYVLEHEGFNNGRHKDIYDLVEAASKCLAEAYQVLGNRHI